ncbi:hypothetical protein [Umezawaea tangerina]|uniref:VCBS repeat protein n=1 Tax=Umezawaea tangerina TaxID=84725 RepID=A0A2T0T2I3_9PSEU|nr:hypothetical protein [Umezawaea tangerina]PRY39867.1 hypothetical protein CLV43_107454 [Umezawaea tangerina]
MRTTALLLALVASATFAAPANAAVQESVQADLDGDGVLETVTTEQVAGDSTKQLLSTTIRGLRLTALVPLDSHVGPLPLRVVDLGGDGTDEVVVAESVGANTVGFGVWGLFGGLRPVTASDGSALRVWEGGGISALNGYGCEDSGGGRSLVTVDARLTNRPQGIYTGKRVTYSVVDGVATETSRAAVAGAWDAPGFQVDPAACA